MLEKVYGDYWKTVIDTMLEGLQESGGNKTAAARLLGVSRVTLWKRLK